MPAPRVDTQHPPAVTHRLSLGTPGRTGAAGGDGDPAPSADLGPRDQLEPAGSPGSREGQRAVRQHLIKYI